MQQITLKLDHGNFYCPITGQNILSSENCEASPATIFIYLDEIGDFAHTSDDLAEVQDSLDDDSDESELDQFLAAIKDTKNLVVFSITVNNGPFSNAVHVGIDMNYCKEGEA
jgi:hypothetical protein